MTMTLSGSGTIAGLVAGGLPDATITAAELASGVPTTSQLPAGTVLQVVYGSYATQTTLTSATWVDSGLTATITPTKATSKILCITNVQGFGKSGNSAAYAGTRLLRDGSLINYIEGEQGYNGLGQNNSTGGSGNTYLDSPATTSAVVYKVQVSNAGGSGSIYYCANNVVSSLTLMEIAA